MSIFEATSGAMSQGGGAAPVTPDGVEAAALENDAILGPILQQMGGLGALAGIPQGGATTQQSLTDILADSAMAVTGRKGLTGSDFSGVLPPWAKDLSPQVLKHPDFDPYFGVVSQQGDERVYMGGEKAYRPASIDEGAPLTEGMSRPEGGTGGTDGGFEDFFNSGDKKVKPQEPVTGSGEAEYRSGGQHSVSETDTKKTKARKGADTLTAMQAMNLPYTWDEEEIAEAMRRMRQAGVNVTSFDRGENSLLTVWGALVDRAAMTYGMSEGRRKVTPWDVLDMYKAEAQANGTFTNYQNGTESVVRRSVAEITEGQAWESLRSTLSQMLGRDPSDQELRDYTYRMNQLAAQNPEISKTIAKYKNGEVVSESTETTGGFTGYDMAQEAYEDAQSNPEYADYQASTLYYNATLSALGAIGQT